jgi:small subunit ribosomal protein S9
MQQVKSDKRQGTRNKAKEGEKLEKSEKKQEKAKPVKLEEKSQTEKERYFEGLGRRKTALARVRLFTKGEKTFIINGKPLNTYFPTFELRRTAKAALEKVGFLDKFRVLVLVKGGGLSAQAEAVRHGTARALLLFNPDFRKPLKRAGFLTRDPRMRERKKFGLKRARRAPQWQKR